VDDCRIPPNDLEAEATVIVTGATSREHLMRAAPIARPEHFYSWENGEIWRAILELTSQGKPTTEITIKQAVLRGHGRREVDPNYVAQLLINTPFLSDIEEHAQIIVNKWQVRQTIVAAQKIAAEGFGVNGDSQGYLERSALLIQEAAKTEQRSEILNSEAIFAPLQPVKWVCKELCIGPGRPTLFVGYGYSLKSYSLQSLAESVATGTKIWGEFRCTKGRVLHIDYEQGKQATRERYQRLAFGANLTSSEFEDMLELTCFPAWYLTSQSAETELERLCTGRALCIIDSFTAATPGVDQIDSRIRTYLDMLTRVSEHTGCSFIVIHHAGKAAEGKDKREVARGNSAIFDACGTVLNMNGKKPFEPVLCEIVKTSANATGRIANTKFYLAPSDIASDDGANDKAGIRIEYEPEDAVDQPQAPRRAFAKLRESVEKVLVSYPHGLSTREVIAKMRVDGHQGRSEDITTVLRNGVVDGWCVEEKREGKGGGKAWKLRTVNDASGEESSTDDDAGGHA